MRIRFTSVLLISVLLIMQLGCDLGILEKTSPEQQDPEQFFSTERGAMQAINATYASMQSNGLYDEELIAVHGAPTDDWRLNNTWGTTLNNWSFTPEEAGGDRIDVVWQTLYEGIFRSNLVLQRVPDIDMDESLKNRVLGEARFMRGFFYWHLVTLFGEVPIITEADPNDPSQAEVGKSPIGEVNELIISDLEQASNMLPLRSEYSSSDLGRATKGAAEALLGKVYLYNEDYSMAEQYFDSVINSNEYSLVEYQDLWVVDNNAESIFEVQYNGSQLGGEGQSTFGWPNGHGGPGNYIPLQDAVDAFEEYDGPTSINGRDPRLFYNIWQEGEPWKPPEEPVYREDWAPSPGYTIKKGRYPVPENHLTQPINRNRTLIRLGDVLLMDAEAANALGKSSKAIDLLNMIRDRVGMPNYPTAEYPVSNQQEIFEAIVHERRVELMFEYVRLHDLRRWGLAEQELGPLGYEAPKHRYFPIPQEEVETNPNLDQNPNY